MALLNRGEAIAVEHGVMFARICILMIVPAMPRWLEDAREELHFHTNQMHTATAIETAVEDHNEELRAAGEAAADHEDDHNDFEPKWSETILAVSH